VFFHGNNDYANAPQCYVKRTQTFLSVTTYQSTWRHTTVNLNLQPELSKNPTSRNIRGIFCGAIACGQSVYKRTINMSLWYAGWQLAACADTNTGWLPDSWQPCKLTGTKSREGMQRAEQNTWDIKYTRQAAGHGNKARSHASDQLNLWHTRRNQISSFGETDESI